MDKLLNKIKDQFIKWDHKITARISLFETLLFIFMAIALTVEFSVRDEGRRPASGPIFYDYVKPEVKPRIPDHLKESEK